MSNEWKKHIILLVLNGLLNTLVRFEKKNAVHTVLITVRRDSASVLQTPRTTKLTPRLKPQEI